MKAQYLDAITTRYGLPDARVDAAPRQFVAETYTIRAGDNSYFCKIIDRAIWIPKVIASLPALDAIHAAGFDRANYPIKTLDGALYIMVDDALIVLYNTINAVQSYDFDPEAFGKLVGEIHELTPQINVEMPRERFALKHQHTFEVQFEELLNSTSGDPIMQGLRDVLRRREALIRRHYAALQRLIDQCRHAAFEMVITHGDAGGNVMMKAPTDLYIMDWDEILLAPAERDLWVHDQNPAFMAGYRQARPHYQTNILARDYCICSQHFDYMAYYLPEITGALSDAYRREKLGEFSDYFDGWIKPFLDKIE
jgi:hypothetical protein